MNNICPCFTAYLFGTTYGIASIFISAIVAFIGIYLMKEYEGD